MSIREFIVNLFTSKHMKMMGDIYESIYAQINEFEEYMNSTPKFHKVVVSDWYKNQVANNITYYKDKADDLWEKKDYPFRDEKDDRNAMHRYFLQIKTACEIIITEAELVKDEIEDSIIELNKFVENGCSNFFKLVPVGYKVTPIPIYCYCPNPTSQLNNVIPFIKGNIYHTGSFGKLPISKDVKIFPCDYHISSDFTMEELEKIYIPRRIEMESITNEVNAKEFINKVKEFYRKSKLKEVYNESIRKE